MAFLDNSGDIILDAVLTDTGRQRLARADGSFRVSKFALGDDEINYEIYNLNHASGSAYYDLEILQTPILEAFTNNMSSMKSKLMSISRTNLLYLPVLKKFEKISNDKRTNPASPFHSFGSTKYTNGTIHTCAVDKTTSDLFQNSAATNATQGILDGFDPNLTAEIIEIHQGIDNASIPDTLELAADLVETQYIIEMDDRLGALADPTSGQVQNYAYLDDDNIASYYITNTSNSNMVKLMQKNTSNPIIDYDASPYYSSLDGAVGSAVGFKIKASIELQSSDYLFNTIGQYPDSNNPLSVNINSIGSNNYLAIDSIIRLTGVTTGYSIDIPIRYIKKI